MPFKARPNIDFKIIDNRIVLSNEFKAKQRKFKKITGSRLANILGANAFTSPVKAWSDMVGIYYEPMDDFYAKAGVEIEPKIKDYVEQITGVKYLQYEPLKINFDIFKDNEVFGGIPDGEPVDENGNLLYPNQPMLEIKTTSIDAFLHKSIDGLLILQKDENGFPIVKAKNEKRQKWFDSNGKIVISDEYKMQLGLYCYLRNITNGIFAVCFLETDDYIDPKQFDISNREVVISEFKIDLKSFAIVAKEAEKWYESHIKTGISPVLSKKDLEWFKVWEEKYNNEHN